MHSAAARRGCESVYEVVNGRHASRAQHLQSVLQHLQELRGWVWHAGAPEWVETYLKLKAWARRSGRLPRRYPAWKKPKRALSAAEEEERSLAIWVKSQRDSRRGGKARCESVLEVVNGRHANRAQLLEELEGWQRGVPQAGMWLEGYSRLQTWQAAHDNSDPRQGIFCEGNIKRKHEMSAAEADEAWLGNWVHHQRNDPHYGGKAVLSGKFEVVGGRRVSRARLLEQLRGWRWAAR